MHLILAASSDPMATSDNPVVRLALIFLAVGGAIGMIANLRNARLWLLLLRGVPAVGEVGSIEMRTGDGGAAMRRPVVAFATVEGKTVYATPEVYRKRCPAEGSEVRVRYAARNPERVVVRGFDLQLREVLSVVLGLAAVVVGTYLSFTL